MATAAVDGRAGGFTIEESARRLGHYRWASMRLFELLGGWVAQVREPEIKVFLAAASRHHGWHAELLRERLPEVRELHPDRQTVPADPNVVAMFDELATLTGPDAAIERLTGVYDVVVPHLVQVQEWHLRRCTEVADASVTRTLRAILDDETEDVRLAQGHLQRQFADEESVTRGESYRRQIDRLLADAGGISGPDTLVDPRDVLGRSSSAPDDVDVPG